ncbi:MAG: DUF2203 domain-containing protein [Chloroflexi bacterium]|nr:DUF2203 domain-containing protein [Chloroflexota bacterium]
MKVRVESAERFRRSRAMLTFSPSTWSALLVPMPANPIYTPQQANQVLPWLTERLTALLSAAAELRNAQNTVETLTRRARGNGDHDLSQELSAAEQSAEGGMRRVRELLNEIKGRGIQVRDVETGLVDFPGERQGEPVWLCWKLGETEVGHWHEFDQGYSSRKPL